MIFHKIDSLQITWYENKPPIGSGNQFLCKALWAWHDNNAPPMTSSLIVFPPKTLSFTDFPPIIWMSPENIDAWHSPESSFRRLEAEKSWNLSTLMEMDKQKKYLEKIIHCKKWLLAIKAFRCKPLNTLLSPKLVSLG